MKAIPFKRELHRGSVGLDVYAVKRALKKAGYGKGIVLNPRLGKSAEINLKRFQRAHGLTDDGVYGPRTHAKLERYFDSYGRLLYARQPSHPDVSTTRLAIVAYAKWGVSTAASWHYAQVRPIPYEQPWKLPKTTDCSGFAKISYHAGGADSPDGLPWGAGNTVSLQAAGRRVISPRPGDLVFYRDPDHVGIYVGGGKVDEFGGEDGPKEVDTWYRTVTDIRSYLP